MQRSQLPAGMQRGNTAGKIAPADPLEAGLADHLGKIRLTRKLADRLDQILIAIGIAGHGLADLWNGIERPRIINLVENRQLDLRELEAKEASARLQHTESFRQSAIDMRHIADTKGDRISVESGILERKLFGLRLDKFGIVGKPILFSAIAPNAKPGAVDIDYRCMGIAVGCLNYAEGNIASPAGYIEHFPVGRF